MSRQEKLITWYMQELHLLNGYYHTLCVRSSSVWANWYGCLSSNSSIVWYKNIWNSFCILLIDFKKANYLNLFVKEIRWNYLNCVIITFQSGKLLFTMHNASYAELPTNTTNVLIFLVIRTHLGYPNEMENKKGKLGLIWSLKSSRGYSG